MLEVRKSIQEGWQRATARNGIILTSFLFLLQLLLEIVNVTMGELQRESVASSLTVLIVLSFGLLLIYIFIVFPLISIISYRTFVSSYQDRVPYSSYKFNIERPLLRLIVGVFIIGFMVLGGLALIIIPGIYIFLALWFFPIYVAVEDQGFYEAIQSSWELTKGEKWQLLSIVLIFLLLGIGGFILSDLVPNYLFSRAVALSISSFVGPLISAFLTVFSLAVQARAYVQLAR